MELEKLIREFLVVIDFYLCGIDKESITVKDRNSDGLNQILKLPIDFNSSDSLRTFRSSTLKDKYTIEVLNAKYPKVPFAKNGMDWFHLQMRKDNTDDVFSAELFHHHSLFKTFIGYAFGKNYSSHQIVHNHEIIDIMYTTDNQKKKFEISNNISPRMNRRISLCENFDEKNVILIVNENDQDILKKEISENEKEAYFQALVYKVKNLIEQANNGIKTLNSAIFEMVSDYYNIQCEFMDLVKNSTSSIEEIETLFVQYFDNVNELNAKMNNDSKEETLVLQKIKDTKEE